MSLIINGVEVDRVLYNGKDLESVYYNGVEVFTSARQVIYELMNIVKILCPEKVKSGGNLVAEIEGATGYLTPETVTVTMDGVALSTDSSASSYYSYDANQGKITVYNCVGAIKISASSDLQYSNIWEFSGSSATKYKGNDLNVTVPYCYKAFTRKGNTYFVISTASKSGYTNVTTLGESLFYGMTTLRNVTVNTPVKYIGSEAFRGCANLQSFSAPAELTTIGQYAFYGCTSLTRSSSASTINAYAYYNCTSLSSLNDKYTGIKFTTVRDYAFYNCSKLSLSDFSFYTVGSYAFWNCNNLRGTATEHTKVAEGKTYSLGQFAFAKTNITKFNIMNIDCKAVPTYGMGCFSSNSLWTISFSSATTYMPYKYITETSTSSNDGGEYKYIYGSVGGSGKGKIVSGDYVPPVYVKTYWDGKVWGSSYCENITSGPGCSGATTITVKNTADPGFEFYATCENASTSTSTFKSAYANVFYRQYGSTDAYVEAKSVKPMHGICYNWYPYSYVTAQSSGCIAFDTPINLADGTTKMIQDITYKDRLLRFNHDTGKVDTSYCHWINKEEVTDKYWEVKFSDDTVLKFIYPHAMYSLDKKCYVHATDETQFSVGMRVPKLIYIDGKPAIDEVKVVSIELKRETIKFCEVITGQFFNCFANNLLTSEPLTVGFQNMYGFNDNMTYKAPVRKQYMDGQYKGYLFSEDYIRDTLRITDKDSIGFRAEEWGMLAEAGYINEEAIHDMIDGFVNNDLHKVDPFKNKQGKNIWPVTTDNDKVVNIDDYLYEEKAEYILPECANENFAGWYCSADSRVYQPGDKYKVKYGTHFTALTK